ncbi:MAG: response regulator [Magnetococcales bacterium]|nr:response regulator [Magnetococcales bacterium]MBF0115064.1 response regulator [Magnetococcales bacterium]
MAAQSKIILLTDSVIIDRMIISGLDKETCDILAVYTKDADFFDRIVEFEPDLVFIKAELSNSLGVEMCDRLRNNAVTKQVKIVFLSSNPNMREQALHRKVNRFLSLPFTPQDVKLAVEMVLTRKPIVLYTDDSDMMHHVVVPALKEEGYEVWEAWDGREAVELLDNVDGKVDLILSDVEMPTMTGHQLCRNVRSSFPYDIPFILLTSLDTEEAVMQGFEAGADDYLLKPVVMPELLARVGRWLSDRSRGAQRVVRPERILVVEDAQSIRTMSVKALTTQGFQVDEAEDGMAALPMLKQHEYDLLVTDFEMPRMDGLELCQKLRQGEAGRADLPIVFATSRTSKTDTVKMRSIGVQAVIAKPFGPDRVAAEVERVLAEVSMQRHRQMIQHFFPEQLLASTAGQQLMGTAGHNPDFADDQSRTVMAIRLVNFVTLAKNMKSLELVKQINQYLATVELVLENYDLPVEQVLGDRLFVSLSGLEAGTQRAVQVGASVLEAVEKLNKQAGYMLKVGIGLHVGHVIVGNVGLRGMGRQLSLLGEGMQVARAVCNAASDSGLFLSAAALKQIQGAEAKEIGPVLIQERSDSVVVSRISKFPEY